MKPAGKPAFPRQTELRSEPLFCADPLIHFVMNVDANMLFDEWVELPNGNYQIFRQWVRNEDGSDAYAIAVCPHLSQTNYVSLGEQVPRGALYVLDVQPPSIPACSQDAISSLQINGLWPSRSMATAL